MSKRRADALSNIQSSSITKRTKEYQTKEDPTRKSANILVDSGSKTGSDGESETGNVPLGEVGFTINEEYAKRFEHNKKREELHRLEEKYQKATKSTSGQYGDKYEEEREESSSDEEEDDEGLLATEALDAEISATLQAIRNKDPRVYDERAKFYKPIENDSEELDVKAEKPMYLRDYHRENLLGGHTSVEESELAPIPRTFAQEQEDLRNAVVKEIHLTTEADNSSESGLEENSGGFLVPKTKTAAPRKDAHGWVGKGITVDSAIADKDPEAFLSNFMAARAWVPTDGIELQPFESDDEEEDERAEMFEAAYNLRFEDPKSSNEVLRSYARDVIVAKSIRREQPKSRKRQRETEQERKEAEKRQREEERARLRRLKIEEMEEKLQKIKKAAGLKIKTVQEEEWTKFLEEDWDDDRWEAEMNKRFGSDYYVDQELGSEDDSSAGEAGCSGKKKRKPKKPKWDGDIDIKDIVPEFEEEEAARGLSFTLSDSEAGVKDGEDASEEPSRKLKSARDREREKLIKKKTARLERKKIEELVDSRMDLEDPVLLGKSKQPTQFRYRETSPISFGLTPRDILMATDASLNQFAGLKKMASFRDSEKKRKDKKRLGKKARLREWRRETFGNEEGPEIIIGNASPAGGVSSSKDAVASGSIIEGKRNRRKKHKGGGNALV